MTAIQTTAFTVNGRTYRTPPRPVVVICLDGSADEYLDAALARGRMPNFQRMSVAGHRGLARGALPSFTNVNNASIVTGVPPSVHGISGNFFYDSAAGEEVMMNSGKFLRCETIFPAAAHAGRKVAVVTAKEKLRDIFAAGLFGVPPSGGESFPGSQRPKNSVTGPAKAGTPSGIAFSSEKAGQAGKASYGIEQVEKFVGKPTPRTSFLSGRRGSAFAGITDAPERSRTSTDLAVHKALNLARLPDPPQPRASRF